MGATPEVWAQRFGMIALVNALLAIAWLIFPLFIDSRISRTIAGGSAGTWGYVGYLLFLTIGFGGFTGFAALYYLIPKAKGGHINDPLAWVHLLLMEIGTLGATSLLGLAGYLGGITILDETSKGTPAKDIPALVHGEISFVIQPIPWIAIFAGLASLGVIVGVVALFIARKPRSASPT